MDNGITHDTESFCGANLLNLPRSAQNRHIVIRGLTVGDGQHLHGYLAASLHADGQRPQAGGNLGDSTKNFASPFLN
jgi:hypothetical protein